MELKEQIFFTLEFHLTTEAIGLAADDDRTQMASSKSKIIFFRNSRAITHSNMGGPTGVMPLCTYIASYFPIENNTRKVRQNPPITPKNLLINCPLEKRMDQVLLEKKE